MSKHFRFFPYRDTRDGDALIVHVGGETWDCGVCSEGRDNHDYDAKCWWCSALRGAWLCDCGKRNDKSSKECSECGREKPEGD